jgi:hypothetical protein
VATKRCPGKFHIKMVEISSYMKFSWGISTWSYAVIFPKILVSTKKSNLKSKYTKKFAVKPISIKHAGYGTNIVNISGLINIADSIRMIIVVG